MDMYRKYLKEIIEKIASLILIILISPIFITITILLYFSTTKSPFFYQLRPGKNEKIFKLVKFKTMNDCRDDKGNLLPDERRLTQLGRLIRKTSLDELPQLINVLKGDMSIVGPRPLLVQYLPLYSEKQKRRHEVKPGITGWAQVNGRNRINWKQKFEYDVWYVDNLSLILDLRILFLTILKVVKSEGISQEGNVTMDAFRG